jgi:hypothetical protein
MRGAIANTGPDQHPPQVWVKFFEHIAEYERLYRALLGSKGSPWFARKMRVTLTDLVKEHEHIPVGQPADVRHLLMFSDTFVPDLVSAMLIEAITWWLEQGRPYPPKEIAARCALLVSAILKEAGTW